MHIFRISLIALAVAGVAYTLGAKEGKARYAEITHAAKSFWNDPQVAKARKRALKSAKKASKKTAKKAERVRHDAAKALHIGR